MASILDADVVAGSLAAPTNAAAAPPLSTLARQRDPGIPHSIEFNPNLPREYNIAIMML